MPRAYLAKAIAEAFTKSLGAWIQGLGFGASISWSYTPLSAKCFG